MAAPLYDHACTLCPLHEEAKTVCVGARFSRTYEPGWHPKILFVGEAPGYAEDRSGEPFVGPAGQLLNEAIKHYGIRDYAITNAVKCRPTDPKGADRKPRAGEMKACAAYLKAELERFKPEIVVPLGATALKRVCGLDKITEWAGRLYEPVGRPWKVYPVIHPAAVLRYEERYQQPFESQMRGLARVASGAAPTPSNYIRVALKEAVARLKKLAETEGPYGFDVETAPLPVGGNAYNPRFSRIFTAAVSPGKGEGFWWVWPTKETELYDLVNAFMDLLRSRATMVPHNAVFEIKHLLWHVVRYAADAAGDPQYWEEYPGGFESFTWKIDDSLLLYYLLHEDAKGYYGLEHVRRAIVPDMPEYDAKVMAKVNEGKAHHEIDLDELGEYNTGDADAALRIATVLKRKVEEKRGLSRAYHDILLPAAFAVARCELAGRKIDFDQVKKLHDDFASTQRDAGYVMRTHPAVKRYCRDEGKDIAEWNPGSTQQVAPIIFDYLELPSLGKTEGGKPSIKGNLIEPFKKKSRFVRAYLEWKEARTLDNNYLTPYMEKTAPDGFLYGGYLLFGTATGRLASVNPNLQNFAPLLRTVVVSRWPDGRIVSADYSQLELRLMAFESGCRLLLEAFARGEDVHALTGTRVCSALFDREVTIEEIAEQHAEAEAANAESWRQEYGKRPNFALLYDAFPKRFAAEFHVGLPTAEIIHRAFHAAYPEIGAYHRRIHGRVKERGWIESRFGRRRRLPLAVGDPPPKTEGWWAQKAAFREASNFPIQSMGSDLNTMAFTRVLAEVDRRGMPVVPLGMTHDSQDFDVSSEAIPDFAAVLRNVMVHQTHTLFPWLTVPLAIDVKVGPSWGSLAKWKG